MIGSVRGTTPALAMFAVVLAFGAAQAGGTPAAREAKASNSMIGTATNVSTPADKFNPVVKIEGKITAAGHRLAYRNCRVDRTIHVTARRISGAIGEEGDTYPTSRSGRFDFESTLDYGGTDSQGRFYDKHVDWAGGTVTFFLSTGRVSVAKDKLGFRSYRCRPLHLTLQVPIPPYPGEIP